MKSTLSIVSLMGLFMWSPVSSHSIYSPGSGQASQSVLSSIFNLNGPIPSTPYTGPGQSDPDYDKTTPQIIEARGWGVQLHFPVTPDGYILALHRIVNPNGNPFNGKPIILQHGLGSTSICWVLNDPNNGFYGEAVNDTNVGGNLGFELAKRGHDVWLSNTRGNKYCKNHTTLTPDDLKFWDFSFDEMIQYDVPTVINHVQQVTDTPIVGWVGHSQGTLMMFGLLSRNNSYSSIVNPFVALAPVTYTSHMGGAVGLIVNVPEAGAFIQGIPGRFPPNNINVAALAAPFCHGLITEYVCNTLFYLLAGGGFTESNMNQTRYGVYIRDDSLDSSNKNIAHFAFDSSEGKFQSFDYQLGNFAKYGSLRPPPYDLAKITSTNMVFISSTGDYQADPKDIAHLIADLKVKVKNFVINDKIFSHINFVYGLTTGKVVNTKVIQVFGH